MREGPPPAGAVSAEALLDAYTQRWAPHVRAGLLQEFEEGAQATRLSVAAAVCSAVDAERARVTAIGTAELAAERGRWQRTLVSAKTSAEEVMARVRHASNSIALDTKAKFHRQLEETLAKARTELAAAATAELGTLRAERDVARTRVKEVEREEVVRRVEMEKAHHTMRIWNRARESRLAGRLRAIELRTTREGSERACAVLTAWALQASRQRAVSRVAGAANSMYAERKRSADAEERAASALSLSDSQAVELTQLGASLDSAREQALFEAGVLIAVLNVELHSLEQAAALSSTHSALAEGEVRTVRETLRETKQELLVSREKARIPPPPVETRDAACDALYPALEPEMARPQQAPEDREALSVHWSLNSLEQLPQKSPVKVRPRGSKFRNATGDNESGDNDEAYQQDSVVVNSVLTAKVAELEALVLTSRVELGLVTLKNRELAAAHSDFKNEAQAAEVLKSELLKCELLRGELLKSELIKRAGEAGARSEELIAERDLALARLVDSAEQVEAYLAEEKARKALAHADADLRVARAVAEATAAAEKRSELQAAALATAANQRVAAAVAVASAVALEVARAAARTTSAQLALLHADIERARGEAAGSAANAALANSRAHAAETNARNAQGQRDAAIVLAEGKVIIATSEKEAAGEVAAAAAARAAAAGRSLALAHAHAMAESEARQRAEAVATSHRRAAADIAMGLANSKGGFSPRAFNSGGAFNPGGGSSSRPHTAIAPSARAHAQAANGNSHNNKHTHYNSNSGNHNNSSHINSSSNHNDDKIHNSSNSNSLPPVAAAWTAARPSTVGGGVGIGSGVGSPATGPTPGESGGRLGAEGSAAAAAAAADSSDSPDPERRQLVLKLPDPVRGTPGSQQATEPGGMAVGPKEQQLTSPWAAESTSSGKPRGAGRRRSVSMAVCFSLAHTPSEAQAPSGASQARKPVRSSVAAWGLQPPPSLAAGMGPVCERGGMSPAPPLLAASTSSPAATTFGSRGAKCGAAVTASSGGASGEWQTGHPVSVKIQAQNSPRNSLRASPSPPNEPRPELV